MHHIYVYLYLCLYTYDIHMYAAYLCHGVDVAAKCVGANYLDTWIAPQYADTSKTSGSLQGIIPAPISSGGLELCSFVPLGIWMCAFLP